MKKVFFLCCAWTIVLFTACRTTESGMVSSNCSDQTRLPWNASVSGISVSRMKTADARTLLSRAHNTPTFTFTMEDTAYTLSGRSLGIHYDFDAALAAVYTERKVTSIPLVADKTVLFARLSQFAEQTKVLPEDAVVTVDRNKAELFSYTTDKPGTKVDVDLLAEAILHAIQHNTRANTYTVEVPTQTVAPTRTLFDIQQMTQPLASFSTSFAASPLNKANRVFNIKKAAAAIHGTVLLPGEEFDCNAILGDRNEQNGWREAAAIRGGMYTTEYGGGVCQVSSTLFNTALMADLLITERYPHSWPMRYVDIGRDATISTGGKNFRFINNFDTPIAIGATVDAKAMTLTCTIYGTPLPKGQYIRIRSMQTATLDVPPSEYILDESLPLATSITERESRQGKTSVTYKDFYAADGTLIESKVIYEDTYRSIAARILVSTDIYYASAKNAAY